jgi:outer membrane scaffolding protein for murein synthesis (MipA/OmpV family)
VPLSTIGHSLTARLTAALGSAAAVLASAQLSPVTVALARDVQAGGMVIVKPKYEGAKDYEVTGAPIIAPAGSGSGLVQFNGLDDLRIRLLDQHGFEAGPLVGYRFGRDQDDADLLDGLGDVDGGLVVGGYAGYRFGAVMPFVSYHHQITGDDTGGVARLGVEARVPLLGALDLKATAGVSWADDDYMQSYFGISAGQAITSTAGLAAYDASSGIKDAFLGASASMPLSERWSLKLTGRYTHLLGDAADSPIVESESQWMGGIGATYRFSTRAE